MKVTLSRAHAIVSRIGTELAALQPKIISGSHPVELQAKPTERQVDALREQANEAALNFKLFRELATLQAQIREAVAQANAKVGVSARLAQVQSNKNIIGLCRSLRPSASAVQVEDVLSQEWPAPSGYGPTRVDVTATPPEWLKEVEELKTRLERENFRLTDELAQLNQRTVTLEISDEHREILGL